MTTKTAPAQPATEETAAPNPPDQPANPPTEPSAAEKVAALAGEPAAAAPASDPARAPAAEYRQWVRHGDSAKGATPLSLDDVKAEIDRLYDAANDEKDPKAPERRAAIEKKLRKHGWKPAMEVTAEREAAKPSVTAAGPVEVVTPPPVKAGAGGDEHAEGALAERADVLKAHDDLKAKVAEAERAVTRFSTGKRDDVVTKAIEIMDERIEVAETKLIEDLELNSADTRGLRVEVKTIKWAKGLLDGAKAREDLSEARKVLYEFEKEHPLYTSPKKAKSTPPLVAPPPGTNGTHPPTNGKAERRAAAATKLDAVQPTLEPLVANAAAEARTEDAERKGDPPFTVCPQKVGQELRGRLATAGFTFTGTAEAHGAVTETALELAFGGYLAAKGKKNREKDAVETLGNLGWTRTPENGPPAAGASAGEVKAAAAPAAA